tara:strand:+ start:15673 stop:15792 length:120 start_codon:yes stop_codon:yes gene_type:complete
MVSCESSIGWALAHPSVPAAHAVIVVIMVSVLVVIVVSL